MSENCCCDNTNNVPENVSIPTTPTTPEPATVSYSDYKILKQDNDNITKQVESKDEELSCKCEIITELELMIISLYSQYVEGGQEKAIVDMGIRLADIYKKYAK